MTAFVRTTDIAPTFTFVQFTGSVSSFGTALNTAFSFTAGFVQCFADTTSGRTSNAVVVAQDNTVLTVPPNNWVGFNNGWAQYPPSQMAGSVFTPVEESGGGDAVSFVPSYAGTRTGYFDPAHSVYNQTSSNMQLFRAWLGRARHGTEASQMLRLGFVGDSITAGYLTSIGTDDPVSQLRVLLEAQGYTVGELVWMWNSSVEDSRVARNNWTVGTKALPYMSADTPGYTMTYTSIAAGSVVEILSTGDSGTFTYTIDGGDAVEINSIGSEMQLTEITGLPNTTHTVVLTATDALAYVAAVGVNNAEGITLMNAAQSGSTTVDWMGGNNYYDPINMFLGALPDVALLELGGNDYGVLDEAAATYGTNLAWLTNHLQTASVTVFMTASMQVLPDDYYVQIYNTADTYNLALLDMNDLVGDLPADLKEEDGEHFNAAGYAIKAEGWADMLQIPRSNILPVEAGAPQELFPLTVGESTYSRVITMRHDNISAISGYLLLNYFTARKTETITKLRSLTGSTPSDGTATVQQMGVYSVADSGDITLVANTTNDATRWTTAYTAYLDDLVSSWSKVAGQTYAIGFLGVSSGALCNLIGPSTPSLGILAEVLEESPQVIGLVSGQTTLPSTVTAGAIVGGGILQQYIEMVP